MEKIIQKVCPKHGLTDYVYYESQKRYRCQKCRSESVSDKRRKNKEELVKYKGGKCEICGYDKCIDALEFHHINQNEKKFQISNGNIKSLERLKEEADKCILVCSNCHHELHHKEHTLALEKKNEEERKNIANYEANCEKYGNKVVKNKKIIFNLETIKEELKHYSQRQIAEINNCSLATLKRFLKDNGLTNDKEKHKLKYMSVDNFIKLFKKNDYKKSKVAKELGVKTLALNEFCYRNAIPWQKDKMIEYMENYTF